MKRILCLVFFVWFGVCSLSSQTLTSTYNAGTPGVRTVTAFVASRTLEADGWRVTVNWNWVNTGGPDYVGLGTGQVFFGSTMVLNRGGASASGSLSMLFPYSQSSVNLMTNISYYSGYDTKNATITQPSQAHKVKVAFTNTSSFPVTYKLMQGSTELGRVTLQPGQGVIQVFSSSSPSDVHVLSEVIDLTQDGSSWVVKPGAVTDMGPQGGLVSTVPGSTVDGDTPQNNIPEPNLPKSPNPAAPKPTTGTGNADDHVWSPRLGSSALTNDVYREGIEKLLDQWLAGSGGSGSGGGSDGVVSAINEMSGKLDVAGSTPSVDDPPAVEEAGILDGKPANAQVSSAVGKLPVSAPIVTLPSTVTGFSVSLKIPGIAPQNLAVDLEDYSAGITVFRGIASAVLALMFWWAVVDNIRKAFAN